MRCLLVPTSEWTPVHLRTEKYPEFSLEDKHGQTENMLTAEDAVAREGHSLFEGYIYDRPGR